MKALLLAAGIGSRLRPITNNIPKCLVPIDGKPLLQYWLDFLIKNGVNEIFINTSYLHHKVEKFISLYENKNKITLIYEKELLNTGGTLLKNEHLLNKGSFFLIHADNLSLFNFKEFVDRDKLSSDSSILTMMLFKTDTPSQCGIVELDKDNNVIDFHEKVLNPPSNLANAAIYICHPNIFKVMKSIKKESLDFSVDVIPKLLGHISTYTNTIYHRDIGTISSYAQAQIDLYNIKKEKAFEV